MLSRASSLNQFLSPHPDRILERPSHGYHTSCDKKKHQVNRSNSFWVITHPDIVGRGSSVVECRTRNQVSPGSNPPLLPFRRLGIFNRSIDTPVHSELCINEYLAIELVV